MSYYPVFLRLEGRKCLVVGGGEVAERKVSSLLESGARVRVVSPHLTPALRERQARGEIEVGLRPFEAADLEGIFLVIAATSEPEVNEKVAREAGRRGILVNVVDSPELCDFIVPSVVRRGDLVVAISTGGHSPALARRLREEMERYFGPEYAHLLALISQVRQELKARGRPAPAEAWQECLDGELLDMVRQGHIQAARERLVSGLQSWERTP